MVVPRNGRGTMKLTNKNVHQLFTEKNNYIVWDSEVKGFGIRVNLNSKKTFILKFRVGQGRSAKVRKPVIGTFGIMKVEEARKIARKWLIEASEGIDPKEVDKTNIMIEDFFQIYLRQYAEIKKKQSSIEEDKRLMRLHILPIFRKVCIKDITRAMITKLHQMMHKTPHGANRVLSLLSKMMNLAEKWEYRPLNSNPCRHIDRYKEEGREVYLKMEQIEKIGIAIKELEKTESLYILVAIKMLLFTGRRTSEILTLRWEFLDFENSKMHLPETKTGAKTFHLSSTAKQLLLSLPSKEGFVFKSIVAGKRLTIVRHVWKKICKLADIKNVRVHDLRHTYASLAVHEGFSLPIISKMLGHTDTRTTERYAHLRDDPVNQAIDKVDQQLERFIKVG
jgi:integrase